MTRWLKVNADAVHHPKAAKGGPWGWCVREACWHIAKSMDCPGGDVTAYWRAGFIRDWSPVLRLHRKGLAYTLEGMSTAVAAGWIDHTDGRYVVHDWDHYQTETTTARKRRERVGTGGNEVRTESNGRERGANGSERASNEVRTSSERVVNEVRTGQPHLMISKELQIDVVGGDGDGDGDGEEKTTTAKRVVAPPTQEAVDATEHWLAVMPWHQTRSADQERVRRRYARDMDRLHRLDRRAWADIRKITDAIAADEGDGRWAGWSRNCIAPVKLRSEDRQGRRYWDVIWAQLIDRPRTSASRGHIGVYRSSEHVHDGSGDIWSGDEEETG